MARIGLAHRQAVAAGHGAEESAETERLQDLQARPVRLVRANAEPAAARPEFGQGLDDAGKRRGHRVPSRPVVDEEAFDQARQRRRRAGCPGIGEAALDQLGGAVADHGPDVRERHGRPALFGQYGVERAMQIGRAVHERAVEIEDQGVALPCHGRGEIRALLSPAPWFRHADLLSWTPGSPVAGCRLIRWRHL